VMMQEENVSLTWSNSIVEKTNEKIRR